MTGIVEHHDGRFELIRYQDFVAEKKSSPRLRSTRALPARPMQTTA
jgi:hypothetical protein